MRVMRWNNLLHLLLTVVIIRRYKVVSCDTKSYKFPVEGHIVSEFESCGTFVAFKRKENQSNTLKVFSCNHSRSGICKFMYNDIA